MTDLETVVAEFKGRVVRAAEEPNQEHQYFASSDVVHEFIQRLKEHESLRFDCCVFITACDNYLDEPRFEVVYCLRSIGNNVDLRINVPVPGEDPVLPTLTDLYPTANWLEREVWDMFGIRFDGHPNLERILMWEGFEGHPLRKDYPLLGNTEGTPGHVGKGGKA